MTQIHSANDNNLTTDYADDTDYCHATAKSEKSL